MRRPEVSDNRLGPQMRPYGRAENPTPSLARLLDAQAAEANVGLGILRSIDVGA